MTFQAGEPKSPRDWTLLKSGNKLLLKKKKHIELRVVFFFNIYSQSLKRSFKAPKQRDSRKIPNHIVLWEVKPSNNMDEWTSW